MADTSISDLTALLAPADEDVLVVDDASEVVGSRTKKLSLNVLSEFLAAAHTFATLTDAPSSYVGYAGYKVTVKDDETGLEFTNGEAYGGLYVANNSTPQSAGTEWEQFIPVGAQACAAENVAIDAVLGTITIEQTGNYDVFLGLSFSGANNITFEFGVAVNGVVSDCLLFSRKMGAGGDIGAGSARNILQLSAGDVLTTVVMADSVATDVVMRDGQFNVHRVSH